MAEPARRGEDGHFTEADLRRDLAALGVRSGTVLVVHSSLRALGWVEGGAGAVVEALHGTLGHEGTLVMSAATPQIEGGRELFDLRATPTRMGAIPETFRNAPGTLRSDHPLESVCARGPAAPAITGVHPAAFSEGPDGPWGKLHDLGADILLLGVGFNRCTALHFAETLASTRRLGAVRIPRRRDGRIVHDTVPNVADDNDTHFPEVGRRYLAAGRGRQGSVGAAPSILCPVRGLAEFAVAYFEDVLAGEAPA